MSRRTMRSPASEDRIVLGQLQPLLSEAAAAGPEEFREMGPFPPVKRDDVDSSLRFPLALTSRVLAVNLKEELLVQWENWAGGKSARPEVQPRLYRRLPGGSRKLIFGLNLPLFPITGLN